MKRLHILMAVAMATLALCGLPGLSACSGQQGSSSAAAVSAAAESFASPAAEPVLLSPEEQRELHVQELLSQMTLEQKVAQMFIVQPESITGVGTVIQAGEGTRQALADYPVGGFIYFAANLESAQQTRDMLANTREFALEASGVVPFLCVDEEGGIVSRIGGNPAFGIENVGNMCDVADADEAHATASEIGAYLHDLGFNVDFAPVADIAVPGSETMALRSFGPTAEDVAPCVSAQVQGFLSTGILCAAKHFPGIGAAYGDSHFEHIQIDATLDEMRERELVPFAAAIDAHVPFIMVGHLNTPNATSDNLPASVSHEIMTDLLRNEMGYDGLIITDALNMGAITELYGDDSALAAIEAGADIVLMPSDFETAYQGILDAVESGELSEARIDESVARILRAKLQLME